MRDAITCTIDATTGNLILTLDPEYREEWSERMAKVGEDSALWEATECYWTNGSFQPFDSGLGNPFVGLTSAPCIAECMDVLDDGTNEIVGRFWFYSAYMVKSFGEELRDNGRTVFQLAR